jgi:tRNA(fMet)-specific endonuclease VapC
VIILDTDVFSLLQAGTSQEAARMAPRVLAEKDEIAVTIVTYEEQMRGWLSFLAKAKNEERRIFAYGRLKEMLDDFARVRVIAYDQVASFHYTRLVKAKLRLSAMDLKIAAVALAHSATLVTRNTRDFEKVIGLKIQDWTKN